MLKEYRVKNNYVIDELDLSDHDFKVKDLHIIQKNKEILVYNTLLKRVQAVDIPTNNYWTGERIQVDLNFYEEQKKFLIQKRLKEDIAKAALAHVAYKNGWIDDYCEEDINIWINYLKNKAIGSNKSIIIPARPRILKDF